MKLYRKDFEEIASALKAVRDGYAPNWDANLFRACDDNAKAVAKVLAASNPGFKRGMFLAACGAKEEV